MKKIALLLALTMLAGTLTACSGEAGSERVINEPEITQIRSICNLATLECYYRNVAKSKKAAGNGIENIGEKEREFWIEYTGIAKIGINMSKVSMEIDGENVTIKIPDAELMGINVESATLNEDSYISSADGINPNKITAADQTRAIEKAQKKMEESVKNNSSLLLTAQTRAQELIENYINQLGEISGVDYKITWKYEDNSTSTEIEKK